MLRPRLIFASLVLHAGCGGELPPVAASGHDVPVAASEPRARVRVVLALLPRIGCDEAFDLALYENRGVELVTWESPPSAVPPGSCRELRATVRYLPRHITRAELVRRVQQLSISVKVEEGT